jgi:hypothetical protein
VTSDNVEYIKLTDHNQSPNPHELLSTEFKAKINKRAETSTDAPRKIIHEALLDVHPGDASAISNYNAAQRSVERKKNNVSVAAPILFKNIKISEELNRSSHVDVGAQLGI